MTAPAVDRLLAAQIKLLREYAQGEEIKRQALGAAEMERFDQAQQESERLFDRIVSLDEQIRRADAAAPGGPAPGRNERLDKLRQMRVQAFAAASAANEASQQAVREVSDEIKRQLDRIRAGRRALSGYRGSGQKKPPTIIAGKL
jgi:uncharacterized protein YdcH (DUF465 family)